MKERTPLAAERANSIRRKSIVIQIPRNLCIAGCLLCADNLLPTWRGVLPKTVVLNGGCVTLFEGTSPALRARDPLKKVCASKEGRDSF